MVSKSITLLTLAVLTLSMSGRAEAQPPDYRTYFTFNAPVTLPGVTLPILTTSQETSDIANADLSRVTGADAQSAAVKVDENPAPTEARGRAQRADADQAQSPAPSTRAQSPSAGASSNAPARDVRADERARGTARTELPRTASSTPLVLLCGILCMAQGLGLTVVARARA